MFGIGAHRTGASRRRKQSSAARYPADTGVGRKIGLCCRGCSESNVGAKQTGQNTRTAAYAVRSEFGHHEPLRFAGSQSLIADQIQTEPGKQVDSDWVNRA